MDIEYNKSQVYKIKTQTTPRISKKLTRRTTNGHHSTFPPNPPPSTGRQSNLWATELRFPIKKFSHQNSEKLEMGPQAKPG